MKSVRCVFWKLLCGGEEAKALVTEVRSSAEKPSRCQAWSVWVSWTVLWMNLPQLTFSSGKLYHTIPYSTSLNPHFLLFHHPGCKQLFLVHALANFQSGKVSVINVMWQPGDIETGAILFEPVQLNDRPTSYWPLVSHGRYLVLSDGWFVLIWKSVHNQMT